MSRRSRSRHVRTGRAVQEWEGRQHLRIGHCQALGQRGAGDRAELLSVLRSRQFQRRDRDGGRQSQRQESGHGPREAGGLARPHSLGEYTGKRNKNMINMKYAESIFMGHR
jgi:hypothetical protein